MTKLVIIRGNSGSGKTTTAKKLQEALPSGKAMLVSQDDVRIHMLGVKDYPGNPAVELIPRICRFGRSECDYVILEGILRADRYKEMLLDLIRFFDEQVTAYYFDLSFAETLCRQKKREKKRQFSIKRMKKWWQPQDYLNIAQERKIDEHMALEEVVEMIFKEISD